MFQISRQVLLFHAKQRGVLQASSSSSTASAFCQIPRAVVASQGLLSYWNGRAMSSSSSSMTEKVPPEDYYNGHLMTDHLEYLDDMLDKTISLEESLDELKVTYAQKKSALADGASEADVEALFEKSAIQKENITRQIEVMKASLKTARSGYAVDAPDGVSDFEITDGFAEAGSIIEFAKEHEKKEDIDKRHEQEHAIKKERARDSEHDW